MRDILSAHTQYVHTLLSDFFGVVMSCGLIGEGRRELEEGLRYGINHMITLGSRGFIFRHILDL